MSKSEFVYVTYIKSSPEKLWNAITNPEFIKQYWFGMHCVSDWKAGSLWKMVSVKGEVCYAGEIIESEPPKRLIIKWRNEWKPELKAEGYSQCTIDIESMGNATKLNIKHVIDKKDSKFIEALSGGWPKVISNLKSLLETGHIVLESM
jgi:uncharacterized protein YndB with AHSA1/START domain